jgi:hypothetical protein
MAAVPAVAREVARAAEQAVVLVEAQEAGSEAALEAERGAALVVAQVEELGAVRVAEVLVEEREVEPAVALAAVVVALALAERAAARARSRIH